MRAQFCRWTLHTIALSLTALSLTSLLLLVSSAARADQGAPSGIAVEPSVFLPSLYVPIEAVAITVGSYHTCALITTGDVKCWGHSGYGQVGDGTTGDAGNRRLAPVDVVGLSSDVEAIAAGSIHTCALTSGGGVQCWGGNEYGQLGDGTIGDANNRRLGPVQVMGLTSGVKAIATGAAYTCALTASGDVKCWGYNNHGQLGDGTTGDEPNHRQLVPKDVVGLSAAVKAIAAGEDHTCALTTAGGVKCWGNNEHGQLGDGTTGDANKRRLTPVDVVGLSSGVEAITVGRYHTCALTGAGGIKCWGFAGYGQVGDGTTGDRTISNSDADRHTPVDVVGLTSGVQAIAAGSIHTCALTDSGGIKCWGDNVYGELGDGTTGDSLHMRLTPVDVVGLTSGVKMIAASGYHTCAVTTFRWAKCWGNNDSGQLGDGTAGNFNRSLTPVDVDWR